MWLFCRFQGLSAHSPNYDFSATHSRLRCLRFGSRVPCPRIGWSHGRTLQLWGFQGNKPSPWVDWNHVQMSKSWGLRAAKRLPMSYCRKAQRSKSQGHQETWPDSMKSWKNSKSVWSVGHLGVAHNPTLDWNAFQMLTPQDCGVNSHDSSFDWSDLQMQCCEDFLAGIKQWLESVTDSSRCLNCSQKLMFRTLSRKVAPRSWWFTSSPNVTVLKVVGQEMWCSAFRLWTNSLPRDNSCSCWGICLSVKFGKFSPKIRLRRPLGNWPFKFQKRFPKVKDWRPSGKWLAFKHPFQFSPNVNSFSWFGQRTASIAWSKSLPNVKCSRASGKSTPSSFWSNESPNVKVKRPCGKHTPSKLWLNWFPNNKPGASGAAWHVSDFDWSCNQTSGSPGSVANSSISQALIKILPKCQLLQSIW